MIFRPKMPLALIIASCMLLASFISFSNPPSAQANYRADSINTRNNEGNTPLNVATKRADVEAVRSLLHSGADPNVRDNEGNTPLASLHSPTPLAQTPLLPKKKPKPKWRLNRMNPVLQPFIPIHRLNSVFFHRLSFTSLAGWFVRRCLFGHPPTRFLIIIGQT